MFRHIVKLFENRITYHHIVAKISKVSVVTDEWDTKPIPQPSAEIDPEGSLFDKCTEDISHVAPYLKPTFNLAAYANKSETLKQLVDFGVDLYKVEKNPEIPPFLLRLDFEKDIKKHILFFHDLGIETEDIARIFTVNTLILREDIDNLQVRINYLQSKKFDNDMIKRLITRNPHWLNFSVQNIDEKLGYFQKKFNLNGKEVRLLATKRPKLITYERYKIELNTFVLTEQIGFTPEELKSVILETPILLVKNQQTLMKTFDYLHLTMKVPIDTIVKMPSVLTCREFRLKQRHKFLEKLGKVQMDPTKPNYISPLTMVQGTDAEFVTDVAKSSIQIYNAFLKTL